MSTTVQRLREGVRAVARVPLLVDTKRNPADLSGESNVSRLRFRPRRRWTKLDWRRARSRSAAFVRRIASLPSLLERSFTDALYPGLLYQEPSELEREAFE